MADNSQAGVPAESRPRRAAGTFEALVLILAGLFVFFWRQPPEIAEAMRLSLPDSDDSLRLMSVRDFLAGQSWFDMTQYRFMPPDGVLMHWSRLVELPIFGGILALKPFLGPALAERVTITAWPLILFLIYAAITVWGTWRLFGRRAAGLAVFVAAQMIVFANLFAPGRIDHHNIEAILVAIGAIGFGLRERRLMALLSGAACGLSLAVVLETLPFVAVIGMAFVLGWVFAGETAARALSRFGAGFGAAPLLAFVAQTPTSRWLAPACDALSYPWLLLTCGAGAGTIALALATPSLRTPLQRLIVALAIGAIPVALFVSVAPACLAGPYAMLPEPYRSELLKVTVEALPFWRFLVLNPSPALQSVAPMLIAALAATFGAWRGAPRERPMLALLAALLWLGIVLSQIQIRTVYVASAFLPFVAGWYLDRLFMHGLSHRNVAARFGSVAVAVLTFGIVWAAIAAGGEALARHGGAGSPQLREPCADPRTLSALDALPPGIVLGQNDLGPPLLVNTHHGVVFGGYHRAPDGVIASFKAYSGSEADMREQVEKFHIDYVTLCPTWLPRSDPEAAFAKQLVRGRTVDWLEALDPGSGPLKVWRVLKGR